MDKAYWYGKRTSSSPTRISYAVTPCAGTQCTTAENTHSTAETLYAANSEQHTANHATAGAETKRKLDSSNYNVVTYKTSDIPGLAAADHWITFHRCKVSSKAVLVKIGTSDIADYWTTLTDEIQRAVAKSYYWCDQYSIVVDVYKGAASKQDNDLLEECLRYKYKPASEEADITSSTSCGTIKNKATDAFCKYGCSNL